MLKIGQLKPGNIKLKDISGQMVTDGVIDTDDRRVIGHALPKATGGFGLTGNYKRFDFSAFFNWSYGNEEYNTGKIAFNMLIRAMAGVIKICYRQWILQKDSHTLIQKANMALPVQ